MTDPLTDAREALAAFDLNTRDIVARRLSGKMKAAPMNRRLPDAEKHLRAALARVDELTAEVERLRAILACLVDDDPCWYDHHGGCQAHGFLSLKGGEKCPMKEAQEVVSAMNVTA